MKDGRLPTYFISHGGGPWPWIKNLMPGDWTLLEESLQAIPRQIKTTPKAILVISGHWEERRFTVQTSPNPPMLYDYGGFPEFTYRIQYPAPGHPEVAQRVVELAGAAGIDIDTNPNRGFDHGVFAPLYVMYPEANVPILQLSLRSGYSPSEHMELGRALAPLRDEGVLIVGSGLSYHNLRAFGAAGVEPSRVFAEWLKETFATTDSKLRAERLVGWEQAPGARQSHPSEDHLIPLMVAVGAAEDEEATVVYDDKDVMGAGVTSLSFAFGL